MTSEVIEKEVSVQQGLLSRAVILNTWVMLFWDYSDIYWMGTKLHNVQWIKLQSYLLNNQHTCTNWSYFASLPFMQWTVEFE